MKRSVFYAAPVWIIGGLSLLTFQAKAAVIATGSVTFVSGQVTASAGFAGSPASTNVTPPNNTGTATQTDGTATSTTVGTFSTSGFSFSFTQTFPDDDQTAGTGLAEFTAGIGTSYGILDPAPGFSDPTADSTYSVDASLYDKSTATYLYDTVNGGSLSGTLTAGDEYQFAANAQLQTMSDPTLTYDPSISFTGASAAPEYPAPMIPVVLGGLALLRHRLRGTGRGSDLNRA